MRILFGSITVYIGFMFLMFGCPLLLVAGGLFYFFDAQTSDWILVPATVTGLRQTQSYDSESNSYDTVYCPYVEFTTTDGQAIETELNECSTPALHETGDSVEVYYNPETPQQAQLKGGVGQIVGTVFIVILGVIGGLLSLVGAVLMGAGIVVALRKSRAA